MKLLYSAVLLKETCSLISIIPLFKIFRLSLISLSLCWIILLLLRFPSFLYTTFRHIKISTSFFWNHNQIKHNCLLIVLSYFPFGLFVLIFNFNNSRLFIQISHWKTSQFIENTFLTNNIYEQIQFSYRFQKASTFKDF